MNKSFNTEQELVLAIHELPDTMEPHRDLWPGILNRLAKAAPAAKPSGNRTGFRYQALAASVAIAFVAGLMFGRQIGIDKPPSRDASGANAFPAGLAMYAAVEAGELEYQAAFREFIPVGSSRALLESQAVENIENSWVELQQAESALLAALGEYPENTYLNHKLLDLRAQQLGFMQQLATLDQFSRRKT